MANVGNQILVTDTNGRLFHTIRLTDGTWEGFGDVKGQAGNPGAFTSVASAYVLVTIPARVVTLVQDVGPRFLDAHEIPSLDFRVVTRPRQENTTQLWRLLDFGGPVFTVQQASSGRFLEAYLTEAQDFQAVTRPERPGDNTQLWRIVDA